MLILDSSEVIKNRAMFSARGAGILGFSMFGSKRYYALDAEMKLDVEGVRSFLEQPQGQPIFLFGFTFMIWQHFYKQLKGTGCSSGSKQRIADTWRRLEEIDFGESKSGRV